MTLVPRIWKNWRKKRLERPLFPHKLFLTHLTLSVEIKTLKWPSPWRICWSDIWVLGRDANSNAEDSSFCNLSYFDGGCLMEQAAAAEQTFLSGFGQSTVELSHKPHFFPLPLVKQWEYTAMGKHLRGSLGKCRHDGGFAVIPWQDLKDFPL